MGKAKTIKLEFEVKASLYSKFVKQQLEDFATDVVFEHIQSEMNSMPVPIPVPYDSNYQKIDKQILALVLERKSQFEKDIKGVLNSCLIDIMTYGSCVLDEHLTELDEKCKIIDEITDIIVEEWSEKLQKIQEAEELEDKKKEEKLLKDLAKQHGYKLVKA